MIEPPNNKKKQVASTFYNIIDLNSVSVVHSGKSICRLVHVNNFAVNFQFQVEMNIEESRIWFSDDSNKVFGAP